MPTYTYATDRYPTLAALVAAHPRAVSSLVRVYRDGGGLHYLNRAEDDEMFALVKAAPAPTRDRDQAPAQVRVRVWNDEYQAIVGAAKAAGMNVRDWATMVLLREAKTAAPPVKPPYVGAVAGLRCATCGGSGGITVQDRVTACPTCLGTGEIEIR